MWLHYGVFAGQILKHHVPYVLDLRLTQPHAPHALPPAPCPTSRSVCAIYVAIDLPSMVPVRPASPLPVCRVGGAGGRMAVLSFFLLPSLLSSADPVSKFLQSHKETVAD